MCGLPAPPNSWRGNLMLTFLACAAAFLIVEISILLAVEIHLNNKHKEAQDMKWAEKFATELENIHGKKKKEKVAA